MKIVHERERCVGCGSCAVLCPKYWKMAEDGKTHLLNSKFDPGKKEWLLEVKTAGCNQEAADVCPVQCIRIEK